MTRRAWQIAEGPNLTDIPQAESTSRGVLIIDVLQPLFVISALNLMVCSRVLNIATM
jgi:hypothetical protein